MTGLFDNLFLLHVLVWCVSFAPFFTMLLYSDSPGEKDANRCALILSDCLMIPLFCFSSYFITKYISYHSVLFIIGNFTVPLLCCAMQSLLRKQHFVSILYSITGALIFSMSVGLTLVDVLIRTSGGITGTRAAALAVAAFASSGLCLFCVWSKPRYIDPFLKHTNERTAAVFCLYPFLFFCMALLLYSVTLRNLGILLQVCGYALCAVGTCCMYYLNSVIAIARQDGVEAQNDRIFLEHALALQQTQYRMLAQSVEQARSSRHDMRFHLRVIEQYALSENTEALISYIADLRERSGIDEAIQTFCDNHAVNAIAGYYIALARDAGANIDAVINVSDAIFLPGAELCVVFGNCMENAVEALAEIPADLPRTLRIRTEETENTLTLLIGNSFAGTRTPVNGKFPSAKHGDGHGIGLESVAAVVARHGGDFSTEIRDGFFIVSVLLFLDTQAKE